LNASSVRSTGEDGISWSLFLGPAALSSGRQSGRAEIGIFTAECYFSAAPNLITS
jgi:hypothetical protein